jgi:hypothetical protein
MHWFLLQNDRKAIITRASSMKDNSLHFRRTGCDYNRGCRAGAWESCFAAS